MLDSAVDPARVWRGMIQVWAEGAEPAFTRWTEWTAARHSAYKLGRTPEAVRKTFYGLVAQADRKPIDLDGTLLTGDDIRLGLRGMFFSARDAAEAVAEVKKAAAGAPQSADRELRTPEPVPPSFGRTVPEDNGDASFWAVVCADTRAWPRDPEQYREDAIRDKARYPLYGDFAAHIKPCAFWKKTGSEPATRIGNKVRALILQNKWDSQTPLTSGQGLHRAMQGSKMVTVAGGVGHGIYGNKSCADETATTYLTTGKLPTKDVTCKAAPAADERHTPTGCRSLHRRASRGWSAASDRQGLQGAHPSTRGRRAACAMGNDLGSPCVNADQRMPSVPVLRRRTGCSTTTGSATPSR
ncbi:hypothetical protein GCM10010469_35200 [Streptomyces labedae]|uniref:Peptidase S33 tripeptidyl aminopeptidase-like C-terminal domain-containing protein n=2 Tax=Streptomyces TaxID=1883 RepID=A0ABQ2U0M4_9ACTN|nr:hypothetical protein GCM10010265_58730 [Streptomyces griseoincarnatus]GGT58577.1 hypothetical protein GCM10010287_35910 [Streptomyces variabilis]